MIVLTPAQRRCLLVGPWADGFGLTDHDMFVEQDEKGCSSVTQTTTQPVTVCGWTPEESCGTRHRWESVNESDTSPRRTSSTSSSPQTPPSRATPSRFVCRDEQVVYVRLSESR